MSDSFVREMELTAHLIQQTLWTTPELDLLRAAGVRVMLGYGPTAVWLQLGERVVSRLDWIRWWDPCQELREEHAAWVAHRLIVEWMERHGIRA